MNNFDLKAIIREVSDWPKPGVGFKDITPVILDPLVFARVIEKMAEQYKHKDIDKIVGVDARGFLFSAPLALNLKKGLVMVRKKGKLPPPTNEEQYILEYGSNTLEINKNAIGPRDKVLIVDDLCALGGTALAACNLVEKQGAEIVGLSFLIDLPFLGGTEKLRERGYLVKSLLEYEE